MNLYELKQKVDSLFESEDADTRVEFQYADNNRDEEANERAIDIFAITDNDPKRVVIVQTDLMYF